MIPCRANDRTGPTNLPEDSLPDISGPANQQDVTANCDGTMRYVCHHCSRRFPTPLRLKEHVVSHTRELLHMCPYCGKGFITAAYLKIHVLTHTSNKTFVCQQCGDGFNSSTHFKKHLTMCAIGNPHACSQCGKWFENLTSLKTHLCPNAPASPPSQKPQVGPHSGKGFTQPSALRIPILTRIVGTPVRDGLSGVCPYCDLKCNGSVALWSHIKEIHKTETNHFSCSKCSSRFTTASCLNKHYMTAHRQRNLLACAYCDQEFRFLQELKAHVYTHTGKKPYVCDQCGKGFLSPSLRHNHMVTHRAKDQVCDQCGKPFNSKEKLKLHMRTHTGEKPCLCPYCGKAFSKASGLSKHIMTHTRERPHVCSHCGKGFGRPAHLRIHIRRMHSGDDTNGGLCRLCVQGFFDEQSLEKHLKAQHQ